MDTVIKDKFDNQLLLQVARKDVLNNDEENEEAITGQTGVCQECCEEQEEDTVQRVFTTNCLRSGSLNINPKI